VLNDSEQMKRTCFFVARIFCLRDGTPAADLDGRSFRDVRSGRSRKANEFIDTSHTGDGEMNVFPQRGVRDERWKLIFDLKPEESVDHALHEGHGDSRQPRRRLFVLGRKAKIDTATATLLATIERHPRWKLYDTHTDPYELGNLATHPGRAARVEALKSRIVTWLQQQHDTAALEAMK
jgi:arylsulfatase A-like enzyme